MGEMQICWLKCMLPDSWLSPALWISAYCFHCRENYKSSGGGFVLLNEGWGLAAGTSGRVEFKRTLWRACVVLWESDVWRFEGWLMTWRKNSSQFSPVSPRKDCFLITFIIYLRILLLIDNDWQKVPICSHAVCGGFCWLFIGPYWWHKWPFLTTFSHGRESLLYWLIDWSEIRRISSKAYSQLIPSHLNWTSLNLSFCKRDDY